jgi:glycosyltransferase involved in cell wall biosynthesis
VPRIDVAALLHGRGLGSQARLRDWVDDATLDALYCRASVFVFLSHYEGFGFTPLEAMARGAVPIVLDTPVAREIYGDAALRVADSAAIVPAVADAIASLLDDPVARVRYRAAAGPVLARYQWAESARRTLACVEEAAGA